MTFKYIIFSIALIESTSSAFELLKNKPTYQRRDAITGQMLTCEMCPPGNFVKKHCSRSHPTICGSCPDLHYTHYWNYLQKCRYCNTFCVDHQYVKQQCNSTHNRACECESGYYLEFEFCLKHSSCPPGAGVLTAGNSLHDATCRRCSNGFFSSTSSSSEHCIAHTNCAAKGLEVNVPGNQYHDTLCTSCIKYIGTSGAKSVCNEALIQFVAYQKIPAKKLRKFLSYFLVENVRKLHRQITTGNKNLVHVTLYPLLVKWKETIKEENLLKEMSSILEKAKLKNIVQNVQKRFL